MLSAKMYTDEYLHELSTRTGCDPSLLERVIYAFGLLEAIQRVGLPFCFKGGTSLMLLLEHPLRLSTDIDIIVDPGTDIDEYIREAGKIFPFVDVEEHMRVGINQIEKRHFNFKYHSPRTNRDVHIVLDVLFEEPQYASTIQKPIKNELLLTKGEDLQVTIPDVNNILGDKLTAIAPHTTGIPFGIDKELEVIKQLFDCASLFDAMTDYQQVCAAYDRVVHTEIAYRGLSITPSDVLKDTINSCICIASRGATGEADYPYFKDGISRIRNHIIGNRFTGNIAGAYACKVLYLTTSMLTGVKELSAIAPDVPQRLDGSGAKRFSYICIVDPSSYAYLVEAAQMLRKAGYEI